MNNQLDQLWVKESGSNESYVDLFECLRSTRDFHENISDQVVIDDKKDDSLALQYRQCGNGFIQQNDFKAAIEQYNKSLCFAENGSVAHSLSYANRSFCFLSLHMYDECLIDIEFALKAGYPEQLMPKLEQRKRTCLDKMNMASVKPALIEPQLNFNSDDNVRCMADNLFISCSTEFGRHFIARCDISEDRVVIVEDALIKLLDDNSKYKRCNNCLKQLRNVIPCAVCTTVMFCVGTCSDNKYHRYECGIKFGSFFDGKTGSAAQKCIKFILRMILFGLESFSSSDELMEFVELFLADADSYSNDIVIADGTAEAMLGIILTQNRLIPYEMGQLKMLIISCIAYDFIMDHPDLKTKFVTQKVQRSLMHLVTQFATAFTANNILLQDWSGAWSDIIDHEAKDTFGSGLFNIATYFNHACMPNAIRLTTANQIIVKTIRPIKKSDQIFVRYGIDPNWSTQLRQERLLNLCGFKCKCRLCLSFGPLLTETFAISTDFRNLSTELGQLIFLSVNEAHKWNAVKDKLFKFVKKYDDGQPVSKSIIVAYEFVRMILMRELSLSTNL